MGRPIKSITNPKLSLNILTPEEVQRIHTATLEVIENVGVRFPSQKVLGYLGSARRQGRPGDLDRESARRI